MRFLALSGAQVVTMSVHPLSTSLSKALNLHLILISQVCLGTALGLPWVCLRSVSGLSWIYLGSVLDLSQICLGSVLGLSHSVVT